MSKTKAVQKSAVSAEMEVYKGTSIEDALKALKAKEEVLGKIHSGKYQTKGIITLGGGRTVNIFEEKDAEVLRRSYASVKAQIGAIVAGNEDLVEIEGFPIPLPEDVKVDGGTATEWLADFRLLILKNQTEARFKLIQSKREELKQYLDIGVISIIINELNPLCR